MAEIDEKDRPGADDDVPFVSVIVPARNACRTIGLQLAALDRQDLGRPFEVIVVNDDSTDGTMGVVRQWRPVGWTLRCVDAEGRPSPARARNLGAQLARGDRLAFCDADDEVAPAWLRAMVAAAPRPGVVVGGKMDEELLNSGARRTHFGTGDDLPLAWWFLPTAAGGNLCAWKCDFERLGGFDESLPYPAEDTDFSWRVQLSGLDLAYASDAIIYYRHHRRASSALRQAFRYGVGGARILDRYADHPDPPHVSSMRLRGSMLLVEVRRSITTRSIVPVLVQVLYEGGLSGAKFLFWARRRSRRRAPRAT